MIEQVTIVGMGALGILYGDRLSRYLGADHVRFLAAGERLERYRREGAWCNGKKCAFQFSDGTDGEAQLLIFAVKAPALEEAIALAAPVWGGDRRPVCAQRCDQRGDPQPGFWSGEGALCGGPGHGCRAGGQPAHLYPRGHPLSGGVPEEDYFDRGDKLEAVWSLFRQAGVDARKEADILHRMWCKFMLNVGVNQVCMAYACGYGGVQAPGPARDTMIAAMNEARKVGACQGCWSPKKDLREYVAVLDSLNPEAMPSMRQDALAHRPSEVELFAGTVIQLAEFYGMQVPVNVYHLQRDPKPHRKGCLPGGGHYRHCHAHHQGHLSGPGCQQPGRHPAGGLCHRPQRPARPLCSLIS